MNIDHQTMEQMVKDVVSRLQAENHSVDEIKAFDPVNPCQGQDGIYSDLNGAIEAADRAQKQYLECSITERKRFIRAVREAFTKPEDPEQIAKRIVEETGMGRVEDKRKKILAAAEKSPGVEDLMTLALSGDDGLTTTEYTPYGMAGVIVPLSCFAETVLSIAIGMLAAGNAAVICPYPAFGKTAMEFVRMINRVLHEAGAPDHLVVMAGQTAADQINQMISHPKINMIVASGGPDIVKKVLSGGKKAIVEGPGNTPVVIDETADIEQAAGDIVNGCSFDNNLSGLSEKEVFAVDAIADYLMFNMKKKGAWHLDDEEMVQKLAGLVITPDGKPSQEYTGKSAAFLLSKIGICAPEDTKVISLFTDMSHPFVQQDFKMPILPLVRVSDVDAAIEEAIAAEHGYRHTAVMHSKNIDKLTKMARKIRTAVFVKNGPSYAGIGIGGEGYTSFTIAGITGEGVTSAKSFAQIRRCVLTGGLSMR